MDLHTDNVSLMDQLDILGSSHEPPGLPGILKPCLREVTALPTWTYCFLACLLADGGPESKESVSLCSTDNL